VLQASRAMAFFPLFCFSMDSRHHGMPALRQRRLVQPQPALNNAHTTQPSARPEALLVTSSSSKNRMDNDPNPVVMYLLYSSPPLASSAPASC
jgi:hypothetical protein